MKTLAAVSRKGAPFPILETLELEEPRSSEVLVRLVATGICHSDIKVHKSIGARSPAPIVLGHEGAGIVERTGSAVTSLAPGDHVVLSGSSCGRCRNCRSNLPTYCDDVIRLSFAGARMDGSTALTKGDERIHSHFFGQSSFSQFALVPERDAVKVGQDLPLEMLGPFGCGVMTGAGAVINSMRVAQGQTIAIFGTGSVGLSAVMAARIVGAAEIIAVDVVPARLALAKELGATETINAKEINAPVADAIRSITRRGADFTFNTTTVPAIYTEALNALAMRGTAGFVAAPDGSWGPDMMRMLVGGRKLQGIILGDAAPQVFIPQLIDHFRRGRLPVDRLVKFYALADIAHAFEDSEAGVTVKPVLRMPPF